LVIEVCSGSANRQLIAVLMTVGWNAADRMQSSWLVIFFSLIDYRERGWLEWVEGR
jgi:hypothetical protein